MLRYKQAPNIHICPATLTEICALFLDVPWAEVWEQACLLQLFLLLCLLGNPALCRDWGIWESKASITTGARRHRNTVGAVPILIPAFNPRVQISLSGIITTNICYRTHSVAFQSHILVLLQCFSPHTAHPFYSFVDSLTFWSSIRWYLFSATDCEGIAQAPSLTVTR